MKYSDRTIPKSPSELKDAITFVLAYAPDHEFPQWTGLDFDGGFEQLFLGTELLRKRFGDRKTDQILDMLRQSKAHIDNGYSKGLEARRPGFDEISWGCWLLQDIIEVVSDRSPYAYPENLYRW